MNQRQKDLFAFLIGNMKDMELELRAQSLVFEALADKLIVPDDLRGALSAARTSAEMRRFVQAKYALLSCTKPISVSRIPIPLVH